MYPSGFEGARGWVQCVGRLVWGVMGCCVICMMGFGFNLVEVLWVGSRLACVAGAEGGVGGCLWGFVVGFGVLCWVMVGCSCYTVRGWVEECWG